MILAHVTKQDFPLWNGMMAWSFVGMIDASLKFFGEYVLQHRSISPGEALELTACLLLFGSGPVLQSTPEKTSVFITYSVALAAVAYGSFVFTVINQMYVLLSHSDVNL